MPLTESVAALAQLRQQGKIRHIGLSNVTADQLAAARQIAPIAAVQNRYSVADRGDDPLVDACAADGVVYLPYRRLGADRSSARRPSPRPAVRSNRSPPGMA